MTNPTLPTPISKIKVPAPMTMRGQMAAHLQPKKEEVGGLWRLAWDLTLVSVFLIPIFVVAYSGIRFSGVWLEVMDKHPLKASLVSLLASALVIVFQVWVARRRWFVSHWGDLQVRLEELAGYLWLCRVPILLQLAMGAVFLLVAQGQESLRTLFEHGERWDGGFWLRAGFFCVSAQMLSVASWYVARELIERFKINDPNSAIKANLPRVLGVSALLIPALALHQASYAYLSAWHPIYQVFAFIPLLLLLVIGPSLLPGLMVVMFFGFTAAYWATRQVVNGEGVAGRAWNSLNQTAISLLIVATVMAVIFAGRQAILEVMASAESTSGKQPNFIIRTIGAVAKMRHRLNQVAWFTLIVFGLFSAAVVAFPAQMDRLSAAGLLLFAMVLFTVIGGALTQWAHRTRMPIFVGLFIAMVVFGLSNDNHPVRQLRMAKPIPPRSPTVDDFVHEWLESAPKRLGWETVSGRRTLPFILCAAEGGGVRAAYWTASVLSGLQDRAPSFAPQIMALSGVSGGALGSSVFSAQVARRLDLKDKGETQSDCLDPVGPAGTGYLPCSRAMLGRDYLSSALSHFLFPDLLQRLLPLPVSVFDRGVALERAWERGFEKSIGGKTFSQPFDMLWQKHGYAVPPLFLNGTWVENGWRVVASPIGFGRDEVAAARSVRDLAPNPIRLSTAAHLSARFTYVSPAGAFSRSGNLAGHAVDGGYFENSGAAMAGDILAAVERVIGPTHNLYVTSRGDSIDVVPVALIIKFQESRRRDSSSIGEGLMVPRPQRFLNETTSPMSTLLNTRTARGDHALDMLKSQISQAAALLPAEAPRPRSIEAILHESEAPLPLGWALSVPAQREMSRQLSAWLDGSDAKELLGLIADAGRSPVTPLSIEMGPSSPLPISGSTKDVKP